MTVLAHIAGIPVEETLLTLGPASVAVVGMGLYTARRHLRSLRARGSAKLLRRARGHG